MIALVAVGFYLVSLAFFISLHFSGSGYNPVKHAVSDYAVGRAAGLFQGYVWLGNLGASGLAYLFFTSKPQFPPFILILLLCMVAARIGVSTFKTDLEGEKRTRQGTLHYLFAILTFGLAYTVIDNATPLFTRAEDAGFTGVVAGRTSLHRSSFTRRRRHHRLQTAAQIFWAG